MLTNPAPLLAIARLKKSYGGAIALRDASLSVAPGEVVALMGENGAGKSTLIKILAGAVPSDSGSIELGGAAAAIHGPEEAHRLGLRFIHQELNVVPALSVAENIFLGRAYPSRFGALVDWRALHARALAALAALDVGHVAPRMMMARLSVGDRMLVKIAATFLEEAATPARLFVMDEPTASLTGGESGRLFAMIARLQQRGCGVLYVSHRIDEVLRIADRIVILRDGETRAILQASEASRSKLIEEMTGRAAGESAATKAWQGARVALSVANLRDGPLRDISFDLRAGEILGVAGLADSGQDRLLKSLIGASRQGAVALDGRILPARGPAQAWARGLAYVPRERRSEGLLLMQDIAGNVALPHLGRLARLGAFLDRRAERAEATALAQRVRLKSTGPRQRVWRLSGGNQQKVLFARAVAGGPKALLLDEPTRGVDVGAKFDIHALLRELAAGGTAILIASSDHEELLALCSRIAIMRDGALHAIVPTEGLSERRLLALCYGERAA